tara:strand:+ start:551 stop:667 length:117 start_codon:yes stop_codon:yes gene_type:complete
VPKLIRLKGFLFVADEIPQLALRASLDLNIFRVNRPEL